MGPGLGSGLRGGRRTFSNPPATHVRGEVPQTDHLPAPPGGGNGYLVLACAALVWGSATFQGFSRGRRSPSAFSHLTLFSDF
eukprot:4693956-Prymnesium_polylepis.1